MCDVDARVGRVPLHDFANQTVSKRLRAKTQIVSFAQYTERDTSHPSIINQGRVTLVGERSGEVGAVRNQPIGRRFCVPDWFRARVD
jgi:hypothetical protein